MDHFLLGWSILPLAQFESVAPNTQWMEFKNVDCSVYLCVGIDALEGMNGRVDCSYEKEGAISPSN